MAEGIDYRRPIKVVAAELAQDFGDNGQAVVDVRVHLSNLRRTLEGGRPMGMAWPERYGHRIRE
jgi:hypothetical protein